MPDSAKTVSFEQTLIDRTRLASLAGDVGVTLTKALDLREALQSCTEAVVTRLDAAFARIWTLNAADQILELQASAGLYTHLDGPHGRVPVGKFKIGLIAQERSPHLTNAVVGDSRVGDQAWAAREGMIAFAGYPLLVGDELVGVLAMFARHPLSDVDFEGLATVARGVALGVARQRTLDAIRESEATSRRRAEDLARLAAALERSNRELDQFAYVASHDLKAPLRGIANLAQWIEEDLGTNVPDQTREHLELLRGRVHRMESLIDGILRYSRAARERSTPEPVNTKRLVTEIVDLLAPGPVAEIEPSPTLPVIVTERLPLQQVLQNLISNALKYSVRPDPHVRISAQRRGQAWEFSVEDNGPGVPEEFRDRIWGIFQRLEARDDVEGAGIGLALVKKIVENRGGTAWVDTGSAGGAAFRFTWPEEHPDDGRSAA